MTRADDDPPSRRLALLASVVDERGHRRDAHGAPGRADGRDHGHPEAHDDGGDDGPGLEHERPRRQGDAEPLEQRFEARRAANTPRPRPIERGHEPEDGGLDEHGAEHLSPAGPHDPQQGQLPGALAHDDRERVEDREPADEQRDEGEDEECGREEPQRLVDAVGLLVGHGLPGHDLDPGGQDLGDGVLDAAPCRRPGLARTSMASKRPISLNRCCAVGRSKAAMVAPARLSAVPNLTRPEMVKVWGGPARRIRTWSPTVKWYLRGRAFVHHDVVGRGGGGALGQVERRQLRVGVEGEADAWVRPRC